MANNPSFLVALNDEQAAVVERVKKSLVEVRNGRDPLSRGAGVIWQPDGIIVTNAHVIHSQTLQVAVADGRMLEARLLAYDQANDIAALAAEATNLDAIELGDSENLHPGQMVFALGHPWGVPRAATAGVVISAGGRLPESPRPNRDWVAVSLRLRPGNSGGPLVDAQGRLLGLNTMMTGPDFGMAVPTHLVRKFMREARVKENYI